MVLQPAFNTPSGRRTLILAVFAALYALACSHVWHTVPNEQALLDACDQLKLDPPAALAMFGEDAAADGSAGKTAETYDPILDDEYDEALDRAGGGGDGGGGGREWLAECEALAGGNEPLHEWPPSAVLFLLFTCNALFYLMRSSTSI